MKYFLFYINCILSVGVALQVICESGWTMCPQSGTCVKVFSKPLSWDDARQHCQTLGGDLVKILDNEMNEFLSDFVTSVGGDVYIGLQMSVSDFNFFTWHGKILEANYVNIQQNKTRTKAKLCGALRNSLTRPRPPWGLKVCSSPFNYVCEKNAANLCAQDWYPNSHAGTCIQVVRNRTSWRIAREHCQTLGGDLAVILNNDVDQFLSDQTVTTSLRLSDSLWIGLNDIGTKGNFKWLHTFVDKVNFTNWNGNQPDSKGEPNCVTIKQTTSQTPFWDDRDCKETRPFICEKFDDCDKEQYGMFCPKSCTSGLCDGNQAACNRRNGVCQNACTNGKYGKDCLKPCSSHCKGPHKACDFLTTSCLFGCEDGYEGDTCKTECSDRTYGEKCLKSCSPNCGGGNKKCHHLNGKCLSGCADGYTGSYCDTVCSDHKYGANCLKTCSPNCEGQNKSCNRINGKCLSGCADGYTGFRCETAEINHRTIAIVAAAVIAGIVLLICILQYEFIHCRRGTRSGKLGAIPEDQHWGQEEQMGEEEHMEEEEYYTDPDMEEHDEESGSMLGDMVPSFFKKKKKRRLDDDSSLHDTGSAVDSITSADYNNRLSLASSTFLTDKHGKSEK